MIEMLLDGRDVICGLRKMDRVIKKSLGCTDLPS